jgi:peptidoglycan/xylan/chitin deacetylase (PgdA/CDA1 family)
MSDSKKQPATPKNFRQWFGKLRRWFDGGPTGFDSVLANFDDCSTVFYKKLFTVLKKEKLFYKI